MLGVVFAFIVTWISGNAIPLFWACVVFGRSGSFASRTRLIDLRNSLFVSLLMSGCLFCFEAIKVAGEPLFGCQCFDVQAAFAGGAGDMEQITAKSSFRLH